MRQQRYGVCKKQQFGNREVMMCFWRHNWKKWDEPVVVDGEDGKQYSMQCRTCERCGKWERKMCRDSW